MHSLIEGAVLATPVVLLFLRDWRATLLSAVALPLSIIPAFAAMDVWAEQARRRRRCERPHRALRLHLQHCFPAKTAWRLGRLR
jgi:hypothetical protein